MNGKSTSFLVTLRTRKGISQTELGRKVFSKLEKDSNVKNESYLQKKVSMWELGNASPTPEELVALSEVLEVPLEELRSSFDPRTPFLATDVFNRLANSKYPSIAMICYSGTPVAPAYPELFATVQAALNGNMCLAMFVPYPDKINIPKLSSRKMFLQSFYPLVETSVLAYRDSLRRGISEEKKSNVAVFIPNEEQSKIILPPFSSRYALITESLPNEQTSKTLYLWVDTKDSSKFEEIGTIAYHPMLSQFQQWEAYYDEVLSFWEKEKKFPSTNTEFLNFNSNSTWKLLE